MSASSRRQSPAILMTLALLSSFALLAVPPSVAADPIYNGYVTLNPDGGETATDGLQIAVGPGTFQIYRNGLMQIFPSALGLPIDIGSLQWALLAENTFNSLGIEDGTSYSWYPEETLTDQAWATTNTEVVDAGPTEWSARTELTSLVGGRTFTLTLTTTYMVPNDYIDIQAVVSSPADVSGPLMLYFAGDFLLDEQDEGPGVLTQREGQRIIAQEGEFTYGGIWETAAHPFDSYMMGDYWCVFFDCDAISGEPYPNTIATDPTIDAAVGVHWDLAAVSGDQTITTRLVFENSQAEIPLELPAEQPECAPVPDMAVSPQFITLAPGGRAVVDVAVRNTSTQLQGYNDLLISLSDGLSVVGTSPEMVNLGQRAALQRFSLDPNETRTVSIEVQAAEALTAAPVHITELFCGGRVQQRIDGVFLTPPPAAAAATAVDAAPEPVTPAVIVLPQALPNTAGTAAVPLSPQLPLLLTATCTIALMLRRR
jgi:hypothetical protein